MAVKWVGKLAGGLLGAVALGPLGAVLGVLIGHQFDEHGAQAERGPYSAAGVAAIGERFFRATFRVMGYLAKADGRVSEAEIAAARAIMEGLRLDEAQVREAIACFTDGKRADFDLSDELRELARACRGRPELLRVFLEIEVQAALAGNNMEGAVRALIARIATALGISRLELAHIEAVLRIQRGGRASGGTYGRTTPPPDRTLDEAYRVLETSAGASDAEVVKAYRRQLNRHHPDKLKANGLPESMMAHAKQRTQQIIEAYELIRERRGLG